MTFQVYVNVASFLLLMIQTSILSLSAVRLVHFLQAYFEYFFNTQVDYGKDLLS